MLVIRCGVSWLYLRLEWRQAGLWLSSEVTIRLKSICWTALVRINVIQPWWKKCYHSTLTYWPVGNLKAIQTC